MNTTVKPNSAEPTTANAMPMPPMRLEGNRFAFLQGSIPTASGHFERQVVQVTRILKRLPG
jgi:hypothetical protein